MIVRAGEEGIDPPPRYPVVECILLINDAGREAVMLTQFSSSSEIKKNSFLQDKETHILELYDKVVAFIKKIDL